MLVQIVNGKSSIIFIDDITREEFGEEAIQRKDEGLTIVQQITSPINMCTKGKITDGPTLSSFQLYASLKEGAKTPMLSIGRVSLGRLNIKPAKNIADQGAGFFAQSTSKMNLQPISIEALSAEATKWLNAPEVIGDDWKISEGHLIWIKQLVDMVSDKDGGKVKVDVPNQYRLYSVPLEDMSEAITHLKVCDSYDSYSDMADKMATYETKSNSRSTRKVPTALF